MRLWNYTKEQSPVLLEDATLTLQEAGLDDGHHILLEVRNVDLSWPSELYALNKAKTSGAVVPVILAKREPGTTGLSNLGNTCFMNSALQCLSNVHPLSAYFLEGYHFGEINRSNPLGTKGVMARRYAELVRELWSGKPTTAPLRLRTIIGQQAPQFMDNMQHDSQELLAFLLDGLHEDLNRIYDKPYVERKDSDRRPDTVVAQESWDGHLQRNQSVIVDLLHGLLRSRVRCQECKFTSISFDPFTFLTLPLPTEMLAVLVSFQHVGLLDILWSYFPFKSIPTLYAS